MTVRVGLIGCGGIVLANHIPGLRLHPEAAVTALCDANPAALETASRQTGATVLFENYADLLERGPVDAVVIATPNVLHHPIAMAAIAAGKHLLCEKPLAMNRMEAEEMAAAGDAAGVRHMTAFTYRFVPAMRYLKHLVDEGVVGTVYHFRATRFQDFGAGPLGWRQLRSQAGSGELGDMLSHRIDFGHYLVGPLARLVSDLRQYLAERRGTDGSIYLSDVDDWVGMLGEFDSGATAVWESSKMATGMGFGGKSHDRCEVNGGAGTLVYELNRPHVIQRGYPDGSGLATEPVPEEFLKAPGSPRDPHSGDPLQTFRYDQSYEFIQAILDRRPCSPSFHDGARVQAVIDAALASAAERRWVSV